MTVMNRLLLLVFGANLVFSSYCTMAMAAVPGENHLTRHALMMCEKQEVPVVSCGQHGAAVRGDHSPCDDETCFVRSVSGDRFAPSQSQISDAALPPQNAASVLVAFAATGLDSAGLLHTPPHLLLNVVLRE